MLMILAGACEQGMAQWASAFAEIALNGASVSPSNAKLLGDLLGPCFFALTMAITRVIYNLLDNAVKFADPDSCITLRVYKDREKAYVSVKDYGQTIPADDLPYIFDRFHKSDRSRSVDKDGVGLGLHLVKTIINNHNEDIVVKSEDGMTEFVFTLPLAE